MASDSGGEQLDEDVIYRDAEAGLADSGRGGPSWKCSLRGPDLALTIVSIILIAVFEIGYRRHQTRMSHDLISYVLPASEMSRGGQPYSDYYINRPPVLFDILRFWGGLFSFQLRSWILLEVGCLAGIFTVTYSLCRTMLSRRVAACFVAVFEISFLFSGRIEMFLAVELLGLLFILISFRVLARPTNSSGSVVLAFALLAIASGVREQYAILIPIAVCSYLLVQQTLPRRLRALRDAFLGVLLVTGIVVLECLANQNLSKFVEIFSQSFRTERRPLSDYPHWFIKSATSVKPNIYVQGENLFLSYTHLSSILFNLFLVSVAAIVALYVAQMVVVSFRKYQIVSSSEWLIACLGIGLITSVGWQSSGVRFSGHYAISSSLGIFLCFMSTVSVLARIIATPAPTANVRRYLQVLCLLLAAPPLAPSTTTVRTLEDAISSASLQDFIDRISISEGDVLTPEEAATREILAGSVREFRCTMNVYGWSPAFYFYTHSRPCTRYFLPNLVTTPAMFREYRSDLIVNPPRVINYGCLDQLTCADLDVGQFEKSVFPFVLVISECYVQVLPIDVGMRTSDVGLYKSRFLESGAQSSCIRAVLERSNNNSV